MAFVEHRRTTAFDIIREWPKESRIQAMEIIAKYGEPQEITETMLVWINNGVWNKTIVHKEPVLHNWPAPHPDVLEQTISFKVPLEKYDDLARFDGSVFVERTKGILGAKCHFESMNYVAINLAHDVIHGKSVEQARKDYEEAFTLTVIQNNPPELAQHLNFQPQDVAQARDPDIETLSSHKE